MTFFIKKENFTGEKLNTKETPIDDIQINNRKNLLAKCFHFQITRLLTKNKLYTM